MKNKEVIVCAAIKYDDGLVVPSVRHWDMLMHRVTDRFHKGSCKQEQGFVTNYGDFLNREDALKIAIKAGQIEPKVGNQDCTRLYSEDLY